MDFSRRMYGAGVACGMILMGCDAPGGGERPASSHIEEDRAEMNLMTFNLRYENADEAGDRAWGERVVGIVGMISEQKPDVLAVQEGLDGQIADLRASLPEYGFTGKGRDDGRRLGEYAGIFHRRDRFIADEKRSGTIWLSDTPDKPGTKTRGSEFPRVAMWVHLVDKTNGREFLAINMHLDHRNQKSRERGVKLMWERLERMEQNDGAVIWMGDFNATEKNPAVRFLQEETSLDLVDTFQTLHPNDQKRGSLHFWMSDPGRQWKVDHIFVSKEFTTVGSKVVKSGEPYLSDHFPVSAKVRWK